MKNILDLHTHTLASGHAYSTLYENIYHARKRGLKVLGTADHGERTPGAASNNFFHNYGTIPRVVEDVIVLCGVEANILNFGGDLDVNLTYRNIDYGIASLHKNVITPGSPEENTDAIIHAIQFPKIKVVGHPDDDNFPQDYPRLVDAMVEAGVIAEINNSSLKVNGPRKGARKNLLTLLQLGREKGLKVAMSSDAHFCTLVGDLPLAEGILSEVNYPEELIINYRETPEEILEELQIPFEK